jgi:hypothetical protein
LQTHRVLFGVVRILGGEQLEAHWLRGRGCTVFDGQQQFLSSSHEVEVGVTPGPEVAATAESLAGKLGCVLAGMVDENDGGVEGAGELS